MRFSTDGAGHFEKDIQVAIQQQTFYFTNHNNTNMNTISSNSFAVLANENNSEQNNTQIKNEKNYSKTFVKIKTSLFANQNKKNSQIKNKKSINT